MLAIFWAIILVTNLHLSLAEVNDDDLVVTLNEPKSTIRGHVLKSTNGNDYYAFQDIPYAKPPVGELRFAEPQSHPGWNGILNATTNTKICIQDGIGEEDCLIVNVFTPVKPSSSSKLPVLFWVHGGAFLRGYCSLIRCGPKHYMDYGVIVVTVHYRLGPFGFLTSEDSVIPGNIGLKDQFLALKWVNKNIAVFGGDPTQVTIGGQSAGSISVSSHVISQKATGLYRAAIMESGTALVHGSYISTARNYSYQLGKILEPSFNYSSSVQLVRILRAASPQDILAASKKIKLIANQVGLLSDLTWGIVTEQYGENRYIREPMQQSLIMRHFDQVPILIGFTSEEILAFVRSADQAKLAAAYHDKDDSFLIPDKFNVPSDSLSAAGATLKKIYTNTTFVEDLASFIAFSSDLGLTNPTIRQAGLSAKYVPVYLYQFAYKGAAHISHLNITNVDGIAHSEELSYMWSRIELTKPRDQAMSRTLLKMWTDFIKTLNPTPEPQLGNFSWPKVSDPINVQYALINDTLSVQNTPKRYKAVKEFFERYARPPYIVF